MMKTLKDPVIYLIEHTSFEVDVAYQLLRQTNDQNKVISFTRDMQDHETHYEFLYDIKECTAQTERSEEKRIKRISIPQMTVLDPEGMALAYRKNLADVLGKTDFEIIVDQELLSNRHQGVLPVIDIAGELYIIDLRLKELRRLTDPGRSISLKKLDLSPEGDEYLFFYDISRHVRVDLDPKLTEFPDQVVLAKIPNEIGLDPVATAAAYGIDERQLLRRFPITNKLTARIISLADTGVPGLISRNRGALRQEHRQIMEAHRPRRGKRL